MFGHVLPRLLLHGVLLQAASFRLSHEKVFTPLVTLAILIQNNPQLASVRKSFPKVAARLMESVSLRASPLLLSRASLSNAVLVVACRCQHMLTALLANGSNATKGSSACDDMLYWMYPACAFSQHG
jgi:hypothetical protein